MTMIDLGNGCLGGALLLTAAGILLLFAAARFQAARFLLLGKLAASLVGVMVTLACVALVALFVNDDFRVWYVAEYSEKALPLGYKLAAFWAGQGGSLLLWVWLLSVMSLLVAWVKPHDESTTVRQRAVTLMTLLAVCGFFLGLMLCAVDDQGMSIASPFRPAESSMADGHGLNPMLQNIGMIAHPPILFLGYAGFTVPFAMMLGAMAAGRRDHAWIGQTRRWTLVSWLFLTVGIILGAQWAYVELAFGGYWAWDPVEIASLWPWLTGTALVHSIMSQQQRGSFKFWNVILIALTFMLCIFGTYVTRSGVIQSVHAFGASNVGTFFLVFLGLCAVLSLLVLVARAGLLRAAVPLESLLSREGVLLAANVLLVAMTLVTLVGVTLPLFTDKTAKKPFYNNSVVPMALVLFALMALGPVLGYGRTFGQVLRRIMVPILAAVVAVTAVAWWGTSNGWILVCAAIGVFAIVCMLSELSNAWVAQARNHGQNLLVALLKLLDGNHRRYGGQMVHLGMVMIMLGVAGSSLLGENRQFTALRPGAALPFAGGTLRFDEFRQVRKANYDAVEAVLTFCNSHGVCETLRPQKRFYDKFEGQSITEVAIHSDLARDVYVTLANWDKDGVAIEAIINPLVNWIWIGGLVIAAGTLYCLLPRLWRRGGSLFQE